MDIPKLITNNALWKYNDSKLHVQTSESGLHSDLYLNTDLIISDVSLVEEIVKNIFSKELQLRKIKPDWIITYPPFGLAIAYALARETGAKFGYVDLKKNICNFDIKNGETIIVVGDDIYSGGSLKETIDIISKMNAKVESPIFTIGNFSGTKKLLNLEVFLYYLKKEIYIQKIIVLCVNPGQKQFCQDQIGIN